MSTAADSHRSGLWVAAASFVLWGLMPLYWHLLKAVPSLQIVAHRIVWSALMVVAWLLWTQGRGWLRAALARPRAAWMLALSGVLIGCNWGLYIWAVNAGHVVETSLGYFINPLLTIMLGVVVLKERLDRAQWVAVGIGTLAIVVLTVDYGRLPWIALTLAASFGLYGFFKKQAAVGAVDSLAVETGALFVPALATLIVIAAQGELAFGRHGAGNTLLLLSTGLVTAVPLLLFAASTRRLPLSVLGLLQYLAPVLQFSVGVGIRHERLPTAELIGFSMVWLALIVLTVDGLRAQRRRGSTPAESAELLAG